MDDYGFKKQNWNATETEVFLEILRKLDMRNCRDGRKVRNHKIFTLAHRRMLAAGYQRTVDQLKFRWKLLKSAYYKSKRNPHSPTLTKIQCWRRYERAMAAIMESEQSVVEAGVNCDGNDSDGEASTPQWTAQPWVESTPQIPDAVVKMEPQLRIGFIGAGNMAFGITKGILSGDILPGSIKVSAPSSRNLGKFEELGVSVTHSNVEVVCESDLVFVAVKPHLTAEVLSEVAHHVTDRHIIVSVAAGVTLATLEQLLPCNAVVMRLMPNLPCVIQEGALLFARGTNAKQEDATLLRSLLHHCGLVEEGPEDWIDIHTGLSGSGVAFVYLFAEALAEGAVKMGMPSALANTIASQTVLGAGRLLRDSGKHPAQLRSEVCTPGGTTIFGLHTLEQGGVRAATMSAVESATKRARELGQKSAALK